MKDIMKGENFVMAGSMSSFHTPLDSLFDLAVHLVPISLAGFIRESMELMGTEYWKEEICKKSTRIFWPILRIMKEATAVLPAW